MRIFFDHIDGIFEGLFTAGSRKAGSKKLPYLEGPRGELTGAQSCQKTNRLFLLYIVHTPLSCVAGMCRILQRSFDRRKRWESKVPWRGRRSASSKVRCMASRPSTRTLGFKGCAVPFVNMSVTLLSE
jgi:hypothetical protein